MVHATERAITIHLANELLIVEIIDVPLWLSTNLLAPEDLVIAIVGFGSGLVVDGCAFLNCLWSFEASVYDVLVNLLLISSELLAIIEVLQNILNLS